MSKEIEAVFERIRGLVDNAYEVAKSALDDVSEKADDFIDQWEKNSKGLMSQFNPGGASKAPEPTPTVDAEVSNAVKREAVAKFYENRGMAKVAEEIRKGAVSDGAVDTAYHGFVKDAV